MSFHTPGPWHTNGTPGNVDSFAIYGDCGQFVASVMYPFAEDCQQKPPDATREANARMIAAAAELYQFAADYLWSEHGECPQHREACPQSPGQLAEIARRILAAVEGGAA